MGSACVWKLHEGLIFQGRVPITFHAHKTLPLQALRPGACKRVLRLCGRRNCTASYTNLAVILHGTPYWRVCYYYSTMDEQNTTNMTSGTASAPAAVAPGAALAPGAAAAPDAAVATGVASSAVATGVASTAVATGVVAGAAAAAPPADAQETLLGTIQWIVMNDQLSAARKVSMVAAITANLASPAAAAPQTAAQLTLLTIQLIVRNEQHTAELTVSMVAALSAKYAPPSAVSASEPAANNLDNPADDQHPPLFPLPACFRFTPAATTFDDLNTEDKKYFYGRKYAYKRYVLDMLQWHSQASIGAPCMVGKDYN